MLSTFRSEWKLGPRASLKTLERLRAFFQFGQRRKWISDNPARELKTAKVSLRPTMPFTHEEMVRILAALDAYGATAGARNAQRLRAFILLLRYSGMRIGYAVTCSIDQVWGETNFSFLRRRQAHLSTAFCRISSCANSSVLRDPPNATTSGQELQRVTVRMANGNEGCSASSRSPRSQAAMRTVFVTPLRSNSCLREFR